MNNYGARRLAALVLLALALIPATAPGQPGGGFRGGPGGFLGGDGTLGLAMRDEVQQELQLVDEQREKVVALADQARDTVREEMREAFSQLRDLGDDERRARFDEVRGRIEALNADLEAKLEKVLLPHQFERLKQIDVQNRLQQRGAAALTSGDLAAALNLTDQQREKLEKRAEQVQAELREKMRQLQTEARDKMLDVLTPEQRAKLEQLMGDAFDLPEDESRFRRRGGPRGEERSERGARNP